MPKKTTDPATSNDAHSDLLRVAAFILFDAMVFHEALAGSTLRGRVRSIRTCPKGTLQTFLASQWQRILEYDYEPIFSLALEILDSFPTSPETESALQSIATVALSTMASGVLRKHDFMGRVYHRLLLRTTGHPRATYYTSLPAARFLAHLTFRSPGTGWDFSNLERISEFRVLDPACGSGTLLSAAYKQIRDAYILSTPGRADLRQLHKTLVESVLRGWDIMDYAAHLTLTTLALHSPDTDVNSSNIVTVADGLDQYGNVCVGSIEFLGQPRLSAKGFGGQGTVRGISGGRDITLVPELVDAVIMNPPFSRSAKPSAKFSYNPADIKKRQAKRLSEIARQLHMPGISKAGLWTYFMILGLSLTKPGGRISMVLPRSSLSGVASSLVRVRYNEKTLVEYIVSNFDPGSDGQKGWCFSEETELGEVLIISTKVKDSADQNKSSRCTWYVNLYRRPTNTVEAAMMAHEVLRIRSMYEEHGVESGGGIRKGVWEEINIGKSTVGTMYAIPQSSIGPNWLVPCTLAQPALNKLVLSWLMDSKHLFVPIASLLQRQTSKHGKTRYAHGPDIKQVKNLFAQANQITSFRVVWGHQSGMNTLLLDNGHIGYGRPKSKKSASFFRSRSSQMLIADRVHMSTDAIVAAVTESPVLATAFWTVRLLREDWAQLLTLWLNSTYGTLIFLAHALSKQGDIFEMKAGQLLGLPVIRPTAGLCASCLEIWNRVMKAQIDRYPSEFANAAQWRGVRRELDEFFSKEAGIEPITWEVYEMLSRDPVICKQPLK